MDGQLFGEHLEHLLVDSLDSSEIREQGPYVMPQPMGYSAWFGYLNFLIECDVREFILYKEQSTFFQKISNM